MKLIRFFIFLILNIALVVVLDQKIGEIPPLGRFLDPFGGLWQNAESQEPHFLPEIKTSQLRQEAEVVYDKDLIPHIFAKNDYDLYFLQGYVTAQHRLWQMEFQTHAAAGRVSEIIGEKAIDYDREQRRRGMLFAAENAVKAIEKDTAVRSRIEAYTQGINAYIESLEYRNLPLEYKLLDYKPEAWSSLKTALLLKYMAKTLTSSDSDIESTNALKRFGKAYFDILYPDTHPEQAPIVNKSNMWSLENIIPLDSGERIVPDEYINVQPIAQPSKDNGSNNWAVSGSKTASGNPILCDDPHLELNFPSIWFVLQLSSPTQNVYGASLPGAAGIIVGFNDSISWGVTNAQRDVLDWYKVSFKDNSKNDYLLDGKWEKTIKKIEEIKVRGSHTFYDTVCYTVWGPVVYDKNFQAAKAGKDKIDMAMRWLAHDTSEEAKTFFMINKAKNYKQFREGLQYYSCPAQNFVFAATSGDIAMTIQGNYPIKWQHQGKFVMDGTKSSQKWQGFIPASQNVYDLNPVRGYVSSANQHPADSTYPYYVYDDYYEYYRNRRINQLLDTMQKVTPKKMMLMHQDNYNLQAAESLHFMLANLDTANLTPPQKEIFDELASWKFYNDPQLIAPTYYQIWWNILYKKLLWDEVIDEEIRIRRPDEFTSIKLLKTKTDFAYFDIKETPQSENATDLIRYSFRQAVEEIGKTALKKVWTDFKATSIEHLLKPLKAFGRFDIKNGGYSHIVNATSSRNGPSWRMVVEMDKKGVKGWGIYPGGQSGNVGSPYYDNFVKDWEKGNYLNLVFLKNPQEANSKIIFRQKFVNK